MRAHQTVAGSQHCTNNGSAQVHVAVAGTETDHLAKLINEKADELDAACVVMASHGKTSFQVGQSSSLKQYAMTLKVSEGDVTCLEEVKACDMPALHTFAVHGLTSGHLR